MSAAIRCRHLHRQRGLPRLQGGSGAGRDSACCAGRLRPPPPRSDSAAAVLRGRRPRARWARSGAFPQEARKAEARFGGFLASILRMSWHQLKACVPDRPVRARYSDFAICSCGGILQICQWYRVCDAGALALAGRALSHPLFISCAVKIAAAARPVEAGLGPARDGWPPTSALALLVKMAAVAIAATVVQSYSAQASVVCRLLSHFAHACAPRPASLREGMSLPRFDPAAKSCSLEPRPTPPSRPQLLSSPENWCLLRGPLGLKGWALGRLRLKRLKTCHGKF